MLPKYQGTLSLKHAKLITDDILPPYNKDGSRPTIGVGHRIQTIKMMRHIHASAYLHGQQHAVLAYQFWQLGLGWEIVS